MYKKDIIKIICCAFVCSVYTPVFAALVAVAPSPSNNKTKFHVSALSLKPYSENLKYAVFVSGNQPLKQSWHNQTVDPSYSPAYELGLIYAVPQTQYNFSIDWLHLKTSDSASKQANHSLDVATIQFVAPAYDVGPAVFGIKRGAGNVQFDFDSVLINAGRLFEYPCLEARVFGGINILRINQTLTATFTDFPGALPTSLTYGLPPDPRFYFQTKNTSDYTGAGPDLGINVQYKGPYGFGVLGQFIGTVTAGTISVNDAFTSRSTRLALFGIGTSHQSITTPNATQIVPGFDTKLGLTYNWVKPNCFDLGIEVGYRIAYYINAISEINPASLVQAGFSFVTPEFATGTMAINTIGSNNSAFGFNGPYVNLTLALPM